VAQALTEVYGPSGYMDALLERWHAALAVAGSLLPAGVSAQLSTARAQDVLLMLWTTLQVGGAMPLVL
jgi:hypothetical protein